LHLRETARTRLPEATALICGAAARNASTSTSCWLAAPTNNSLRMWPVDTGHRGADALSFTFQGPPWLMVTGGLYSCSQVAHLLPSSEAGDREGRCMLLAGWDGATIPVAAIRLNQTSLAAATSGQLISALSAPLPSRAAAESDDGNDTLSQRALRAMHLEVASGRLWAVWADGTLQAWDVLAAQSIGHWRSQVLRRAGWRAPTAIAVCGGSDDSQEVDLYALEPPRSGSSWPFQGQSQAAAATLLRARLPARLQYRQQQQQQQWSHDWTESTQRASTTMRE